MTEPDVLSGSDVGPRVVRGGAQRVLAFGVGNGLVAIGSIFLLHHLGVVDFGRYGTVLALVAIVAGVTDAGLTITGTRELAVRPAAERRELLSVIVALRIALAAVGIAAAVGFALLAGYDDTMVLGTLLAGAGALLVAWQGALSLPLSVDLRNGALAALDVVRQAVLAAGILILVALDAGLLPFLGLILAVGVAGLAMLPFLVGRRGMVRPSWDRAAWRDLIVRALPIAIASVLGVIYFRILVLMSSVLNTDVEHGYLVTSARILELLVSLPLLLTGVALPVVSVAASQDPARLRYVLQRMTEVAGLLGVLTAVFLAFAAEPIIVLLGGEEFRLAAPVLRVQGIAMITIFFVQAWVVALVALERQRDMAWCTVVGIVAVLIAGATLIAPLDAVGGGLATVVADTALALVMLGALRRAGPGRELSFGFVPRLALAAAISLSPKLIPGLPDLVGAGLSVGLFAAAALLLKLVPGEVLALVQRKVVP